MKKITLFNSDTNLFSEKAYKKEINKEKNFQKQLHKKLEQKQKEEEKKRKVLEQINKNKRPKNIPKHKINLSQKRFTKQDTPFRNLEVNAQESATLNIPKHQKPLTVNRKQSTGDLKLPQISVRIPSKKELENHLLKLSDKYDEGIKRTRTLYKKLIELGLTDNGLKEIRYETNKKRKKRINKINKIHSELIKTLEKNKKREKEIEFLGEQLRK